MPLGGGVLQGAARAAASEALAQAARSLGRPAPRGVQARHRAGAQAGARSLEPGSPGSLAWPAWEGRMMRGTCTTPWSPPAPQRRLVQVSARGRAEQTETHQQGAASAQV